MIHPDLLTSLHNFFPSVALIEKSASDHSDYRDEELTWTTRHADVPCVVAPGATTGSKEVKKDDMTYVVATHHVTLAGYYDDIIEKDHVVVDGLTLDILLVESDSHHKTTRLSCEVVR